MAFRPLDDVSPKRLFHLLRRNRKLIGGGVRETSRFVTYPVDLRRPANGTVDGEVHCGACGKPVRVTMYSEAKTRIVRQRRVLFAFIGLVALIVSFALIGRMPPGSDWLRMVGHFAGFALIAVSLGSWWSEDGLHLSRTESRESRRLHSLRLPRDEDMSD